MADRARAKQGTVLRASGKDGPQIVATGEHRWDQADERVFLDTLAATCNVRASAAAAGFSTAAIYWRRRHHPDFARRWASALEQGYARLEMLLVQRATEALEGHDADPDADPHAVAGGIAPLTAKEAIQILRLHQSQVHGGGAAHPGWRARPRSLDEVRDSILAKLEAVAPAPEAAPGPAPKSCEPGG